LLTEFREERKLSQQKMAELFEISQVEYCRIETGERRPTPALAARIQKVTGFSLAFLLGVE
jgi:transcriptional regulator with XRE-family HTH domain